MEKSFIWNQKKHNNSLHADCHKRHIFYEKKKPQKLRHLWQPVKLALCVIDMKNTILFLYTIFGAYLFFVFFKEFTEYFSEVIPYTNGVRINVVVFLIGREILISLIGCLIVSLCSFILYDKKSLLISLIIMAPVYLTMIISRFIDWNDKPATFIAVISALTLIVGSFIINSLLQKSVLKSVYT